MRFPWVLRSDYEQYIKIAEMAIHTQQDIIADKSEQLIQKEKEIQALIDQLAQNSNVKQEVSKKFETPILTGRSGWRAKAELKTRATIKPKSDSAAQLEERVKKEGGK
jgi:hypothetical protein